MAMCGGVSKGDIAQIEAYQRTALEQACSSRGHTLVSIEGYTRQVVAGFKFGYDVTLADGKAHVEIWHKPGNAAVECTKFEMQ